MQFDIITIFPEAFTSYFNASILKRAQEKSGGAGSGFAGKPLVTIAVHNLRDYTTDKHKTVDGSPYGGGAGMVMKVEPIWKAVTALKKKQDTRNKHQTNFKSKISKSKTILLAAGGKQFDQRMAEKFAKLDQIIFICGHYEGVDERVMEFVDEAISVGPYVLTGGELPTMTIVDAVTRLIPGVLGNSKSLDEESFGSLKSIKPKVHKVNNDFQLSTFDFGLSREYPHYTRPEVFVPKKGTCWAVPKVLLSGNHKKIAQWRRKHCV